MKTGITATRQDKVVFTHVPVSENRITRVCKDVCRSISHIHSHTGSCTHRPKQNTPLHFTSASSPASASWSRTIRTHDGTAGQSGAARDFNEQKQVKHSKFKLGMASRVALAVWALLFTCRAVQVRPFAFICIDLASLFDFNSRTRLMSTILMIFSPGIKWS